MDRVEYTSMIIQDLVNLEKKKELNTKPWYQRRSVWTQAQKSYLINSIFESKPIPNIYIRHSLDLELAKSIKEVVDGQQRSKAIIGYCNDDFPARHPDYAKPIKYSALSVPQRQNFLLTAIPVGYLLGASDADVIDIFARINSVSKTLNAQEKRNAQYSGEFKQFCVNQAVKRTEFWKDYGIFTGTDIARMAEVQFISDVTINFIEGLSDYSEAKITKYYKEKDEVFEDNEKCGKQMDKIFDFLVSINPDAIKQTIFKRQPLFFSLLVVLKDMPAFNKAKIEKGLFEIDERFNSDVPVQNRSAEDIQFHTASSNTTQRIVNRKIRDTYIRKYIV